MKKILIIEDDHLVANVYRNKLAVEGFIAEIAYDGRTGLEMVQAFRPDLILLDLVLPEMPGVEVLKKVRATAGFENLPIIVFSNTYLTNMVKGAWRAGATKCFSKASCTPKQVLDAIRSLLPATDSYTASAPPILTTAELKAIPQATKIEKVPATVPKAPPVISPLATKPEPQLEPVSAFNSSFPPALSALRTSLQILVKSSDDPSRLLQLEEMFAKIRGIDGTAGVAGMVGIAKMAEALEALLKELYEKPHNINNSTLRTFATAIDFLDVLFQSGKSLEHWNQPPPNILVVDDELLSRRAVTHALEMAKLRAQEVEDPTVAMRMLSETPYDLILLDVDMPGMNGFELCAMLRALPAHQKTPVVFVTVLNDFDARANSAIVGANDLIAKPFMFIELAVKALVYVLSGRLELAK